VRRAAIFRILGGAVIVLALLSGAGWLAFVPSAREPAYVFVDAWGGKGSGPGQFDDPTGIAVAHGEVLVSDARNGRIQVFDLEGNFKRQIGAPGQGPGGLGRPMNLSVADGEVYVADYWNDRIQVFALDGRPRRTIGGPGSGPGQFNAPGGVAVAADGDVFVADFHNQRVQHLRADGTFSSGNGGPPARRAAAPVSSSIPPTWRWRPMAPFTSPTDTPTASRRSPPAAPFPTSGAAPSP
jgi:hypothetical protein